MLAEISELAAEMERSGCRTLGEYLAREQERFAHEDTEGNGRVRGRHTRRDMYEQEFDAVWSAQSKHLEDFLTDDLRERIRREIFYQRKMRWPKSIVGRCELEPKLRRCPRAARTAQRFRLLQEVNNLRFLDRTTGAECGLAPEERRELVTYLQASKERTFDQIRKKLGLLQNVGFNLEGPERSKLKGNETDAALSSKKGLGKRWKELSEEEKNGIVEILVTEEQEDVAIHCLREGYGLSAEEAERALAVNLPPGHARFSQAAIEKLLPHLERGLPLMGDDASNSALHAAGYLRPDERVVRQREFLPPAPDVPNPIVRQALVEVRKVVNAVIREYGKPHRIHVELAREAKKSFRQRQELRFEMAKRRRERERAAATIEELGDKATAGKIQRYQLWREQEGICVYSGRSISLAQLFSDAVSVDHILPRWRSLDNSMANKVVCFRDENANKGDRTPFEWLAEGDAERYERVLRAAERLPYNKRRKFALQEIRLDDFVNRQLGDTAYTSRLVTQYLRSLGTEILTQRGQMTADLRRFWGLNTILDSEGGAQKSRTDHRHHAIDALVIALTDRKRLYALANSRGEDLERPWQDFREHVAAAVLSINVSYRARRRLHGALHEDTFYGATQKRGEERVGEAVSNRPWARGWIEEEGVFVRRKPVTEVKNAKHLEKVRDAGVQAILRRHLLTQGIDPSQKGGYPADAFKGQKIPRMPCGRPIKRVRMLEESDTIRPVSEQRRYQWVKPGNNHHIVYRSQTRGGEQHWVGEVVTTWDAAGRARSGIPIVDRSEVDGRRFVMSLSIGEAFEMDDPIHGERGLYVVRKLEQGLNRLYYKRASDARKATEIEKDKRYKRLSAARFQAQHPRKVTVNVLGEIRVAND